MINENLLNRATNFVEKDLQLNEENKKELLEGIGKIGESRDRIDNLIQSTKIAVIQNSFHLLIQRIMSEDKNGVIEMLDNNRDVINMYDFLESFEALLKEYINYKKLYEDDYPEIKKIKETLVLYEKDLLPLLSEIVNHKK
jgi:hypothetical protein